MGRSDDFHIENKDYDVIKLETELNETIKELITNNKELERQKELAQHYIDVAGVMLLSIDKEENVVLVNKKTCDILGYKKEEIIGKNWFDNFLPKEDLLIIKKIFHNIIDNNNLEKYESFQNSIVNKNGEERIISWNNSIIRDEHGEPICLFSSGQDITDELKLKEQLIIEKNNAIESNKLKSVFLANMSHEIRTPMNSIIGFSDLLLRNDYNKEKRNEYLNIINRNSEQLLNHLSDLVDYSKLEINQLKLIKSTFSIKELIKEVYDIFLFNDKIKNKDICFSYYVKQECQINTDRSRLKQILSNLISNSIKFTEYGNIEFGCYFINNKLKCYVKDTGKGISKEFREKIFDMFYQIEQEESKRKDGTGLGLSIVKGLIELLDGKIDFKSIPDKGTIFIMEIPIEIKDEIKEINIKNIKYDFSDKLILIAEDMKDNYNLLEGILYQTNCNIKWVKNGLDCVNYARYNKVDLILMDIRMPIVNGYDAIRTIRKFNNEVPIITQTAYAFSDDIKMLENIGSNDYVSKPVINDILLEKMNFLLK